ncbi:hypothetical protein FPQ18DRAFT_393407 [Pyronema domesticum]|nr:hypothetical protein FPQ18DRAFT_393407 [Pyronema domesticum]
MSIHGAWEDLPLKVTGYCSDDADMEADDTEVGNGTIEKEAKQPEEERDNPDKLCGWEELMEDSWDKTEAEEEDDEELLE